MKSYNGFTPEQRETGDKIIKEAVAKGIIPKANATPCVLCGQDKGIRHYHCEDYSPDKIVADTRVLCWRCHMMLHTRYKHPLSYGKYMIDVAIYHKQFDPVFKPDAWEELEKHYID